MDGILFAVFVPPFLAMTMVSIVMQWQVLSRLRRDHPSVYDKMGRPRMFRPRGWGSSLADFRFMGYPFSDAHEALGDPEISWRVQRLVKLFWVQAAVLITFLVVLFAGMVWAEFSTDDDEAFGPQPATDIRPDPEA